MSEINLKKLENQFQKAIKSGKGFMHTSNNGKKYKIAKRDIEILKNKYENKLAKKGGFLPLIPLFAGLSALGALSGGAAGIASAVNNYNHNKEMERIAEEKGVTIVPGSGMTEGGSLFLNPYHGKGIKDFIKGIVKNYNVEEIGKKAIIDVLKNIAVNGANINVEGGALFLNPYH